jgi:pilus assembly protein TadC
MDARHRAGRRLGVRFLLGLACGGVAGMPFARLARRETVLARVRSLGSRSTGGVGERLAERLRRIPCPPPVASIARVLAAPRARRRQRRQGAAFGRELPVVVDLVGVAVGAGCTPYLAIEHAARFGPEHTARALRDVSHSCALGQSLDDALRALGTSIGALRPLADALRTSAALGSPAAPALARLATDVRADARRRAEARARTVPVRLCFPLVACVLPAFALLTVAPVVLGGLRT